MVGALLAAAYLPNGTAWSASAGPNRAAEAEQTKVSDSELKAFIKAYVAYHRIRQSYETKMAAAKDQKAKEQLQREGDDKVKQALQQQGLTPQSYNRLFVAVNNNPQLRQKALALISEERGKSS
jgi:hypothetical protein